MHCGHPYPKSFHSTDFFESIRSSCNSHSEPHSFPIKHFKFLGGKNSQNRLGPTFKYHTQLSKTSVQLVSVNALSFYDETRRE